jgi:CRISPR/Cas system-associated exonuclease Cas4 (RecB family)
MPKPKPKIIKAWSFSRLNVYEECPAKAKYKYIDKLNEGPKGKALERGSKIHKLAESYLSKKLQVADMPEELDLFEEEFHELRKTKGLQLEGQVAFNADWDEVDWFDDDVWVRLVFDGAAIIEENDKVIYRIIDFKTGKIRQKNELQLELYALAGFALQGVDIVRGELWYLDQGELVELEYDYDQLDAIDKAWRARSDRMLNDRSFKPTPSTSACQWCPFTKSKKGPCKY